MEVEIDFGPVRNRKKTNPHSISSQAQLHSSILKCSTSSFHPKSSAGVGEKDCSSHQLLSAAPSFSHFSPASECILFMCCGVKLLLHGLLSMHHSSCLQPAPVWALQGLQHFQGISTCCSMGSSEGCSADVCSGMVLSMDYWQIPAPPWFSSGATTPTISAAAPWALLPSPSSMTLVTAWLCLTILSPLTPLSAEQCFLLFLKYVSAKVPSGWVRGSTLPCSWLAGADSNGLFPAWSSPGLFSRKTLLHTPF